MKNEMPKIPNSNYRLFKKGSKLILSAATFGLVARSFQGVNYVVITTIKKIQQYKVQMSSTLQLNQHQM